MAKSDFLEEALLDWLGGTPFPTPPTALYLALSLTDPLDDGSGINEPLVASGYARQLITLSAIIQVAGRARRSNTNILQFPQATDDWGIIPYGAIFDDVIAGRFLYGESLNQAVTVLSGGNISFPIGTMIVEDS